MHEGMAMGVPLGALTTVGVRPARDVGATGAGRLRTNPFFDAAGPNLTRVRRPVP
jgi:hypothetical protein